MELKIAQHTNKAHLKEGMLFVRFSIFCIILHLFHHFMLFCNTCIIFLYISYVCFILHRLHHFVYFCRMLMLFQSPCVIYYLLHHLHHLPFICITMQYHLHYTAVCSIASIGLFLIIDIMSHVFYFVQHKSPIACPTTTRVRYIIMTSSSKKP